MNFRLHEVSLPMSNVITQVKGNNKHTPVITTMPPVQVRQWAGVMKTAAGVILHARAPKGAGACQLVYSQVKVISSNGNRLKKPCHPAWLDKLKSFLSLTEGWNGYNAPPPSWIAVRNAALFLSAMDAANQVSSRIAPSAMGGVGITCSRDGRKVYVEFYNQGTAHVLFSRGRAGMSTQPLRVDLEAFQELIGKIQEYLNG
jgi:hypothetical protein